MPSGIYIRKPLPEETKKKISNTIKGNIEYTIKRCKKCIKCNRWRFKTSFTENLNKCKMCYKEESKIKWARWTLRIRDAQLKKRNNDFETTLLKENPFNPESLFWKTDLEEICSEFGCSKTLSRQEKLFGDKCINHQNKSKYGSSA